MNEYSIRLIGMGSQVEIGEITTQEADFLLTDPQQYMGKFVKLPGRVSEMDRTDNIPYNEINMDTTRMNAANIDESKIDVYENGEFFTSIYPDEVQFVDDGYDEFNMDDSKCYIVSVRKEEGCYLEMEFEDEEFDEDEMIVKCFEIDSEYVRGDFVKEIVYKDEISDIGEPDEIDFVQYLVINGETKYIKYGE